MTDEAGRGIVVVVRTQNVGVCSTIALDCIVIASKIVETEAPAGVTGIGVRVPAGVRKIQRQRI